MSDANENVGDNGYNASATGFGNVDWSSLVIEQNDDGFNVPVTEDRMFAFLGLRDEEDERPMEAPSLNDTSVDDRSAHGTNIDVGDNTNDEDVDTEGAAIPVDDHVSEEENFDYDTDNPNMEEGSTFPSMEVFRVALKQYAITGEFDIGTLRSEPGRFEGVCKAEGCNWTIKAKKVQHEGAVMVTNVENEHECLTSSRKPSSMASQSWVADRALPILRKKPETSAAEVQEKLEEDFGITLKYWTVWKGRERAMRILYGTWEESFQLLYSFKAEIELRSPGSIVEIDTKDVDGEVHFNRFFIALKPCIDGFLSGCRPYISIDSTHLNGKWNGQLAVATALDGHNWMFPIAFGFFDAETTENWTWFMSQLKRAIGDLPILAVCTDACKGLENAVKVVFPNAEKRECIKHLMANFVKKFRDKVYSRMWPAARAYEREIFDHHMSKIFAASVKVAPYLLEYHNLLWMRCGFNPDIKCDSITNNLAETFNSWIRDIKDLPIVQLVDKLREKVMVLLKKRRAIGARLKGKILPAIIQELNVRSRGLGHLKTRASGDWSAEVKDTTKNDLRHVVKCLTCECTCLEWQHTGKPCRHALVVLAAQKIKLEDFVHEYYSVARFRAAYQGEIEPLTGKSQWPTVDPGFVLKPPISKRGRGRPRKLRIKACTESGYQRKKKVQTGGKNRCKRCQELGHRQAGCPLNGTKKRKSRSKRNTVPWDHASTSKNGYPSTPTSPGPITRSQSSCDHSTPMRTDILAQPSTSPGPVTRSQSARIPSTPMRTDTFAQPGISPGPVTRSQSALFGDGGSQFASTASPARTPTKSKIRTAKKITPKKRRIN